MTSHENENHVIAQWREDIETRARGGKRGVQRGTRGSRAVAPGTWTAEGRLQCANQMDIWACIAEAEADQEREQQERGDQQ